MCHATIKLNSFKDLFSFVDALSECSGNYEIITGSHSIHVGSLISMLSLDITKPFQLTINSEQPEEVLCLIEPFILQE